MTQENPVQKKRNIKIIALAVICVILAASLVGVVAVYQPNQFAEKQATIDSLNQQIAALQLQLSQNVNTSVITSAYVLQIASLNAQLSDLNNTLTSVYTASLSDQQIAQLQKSGVMYQQDLTQNANSYTTIWSNDVGYAGYIVIQATSTANTTYAEVLFTFGDSTFDYNKTLGTSGTAVFPVLPSTVEIRIGNLMQADKNNATVTATYYY